MATLARRQLTIILGYATMQDRSGPADGGPFIAARIQPAFDTFGTVGVAFMLQLGLFVVSRVIVASATLNAALTHGRWAGSGGGAVRMIQPWRLLAGGAHMGVAVGRGVTRPVAGLVAAGQQAGSWLALDALDALLASTTAEVATDRVLASPWTERTVSKALTGPLVGVAAREVAQGAVLEQVLDEVLATEVLDHIVDRAEQAGARRRK